METWLVFIIAFGIALIFLIIAASRKNKKKTRQPEKTIQTYLSYGDFISAGKLYLRQKNYVEAANLYFRTPLDKRPLFESIVQQELGPKEAQLFWIKTGRRFERSDPERAKIAYLLAGAYFDVIKMFIDRNDADTVIDLVKYIPPKFQEQTVRKLSQYSFNRGKYRISSELLRAIGFVDEADAILAVGAHDYQAIEQPGVSASMYGELGRQDLVGESQEERGERALAAGRIEEAKEAFKQAIKAYDDSNQPKDALRVEKRLEKFVLLDKFRDYAAAGDIDSAEEMIQEISDVFPALATSDLYAEIAVVLERNGNFSEAVNYYDKAADLTNNPLKKQSYVNALRRLASQIAAQRASGEAIATADLPEPCPVCRRPIAKGQKIATCPYCHSVAHYSHLVEWVKVQGTCPICRRHLKTDDFKTE
ncbi:MAG: tetratricopeptide repeat protein [Candidatus Heimdallarchaeota archaeon]|nr:tetratricopeptide repeat protein [Candidatus Heimdallarchaeota archaeon]